jgi:hypothetical protein
MADVTLAFDLALIADPKTPASSSDVILATTIGRDDFLPSGILVLWVPGWEHTSKEMNYGFVDNLSQLLIVLNNYAPAGASKSTGFVTAYKHNFLLHNSLTLELIL